MNNYFDALGGALERGRKAITPDAIACIWNILNLPTWTYE
jgi:hypothetical protein